MAVSAKIKEQHGRAIAAAHALRSAVEAGRLPDGFGRLRMVFAESSRETLETLQRTMASLKPDMRAQLPGLSQITETERDLRMLYSAHVARWPMSAIEADFAGYAAEVRSLVSRVEPHIRLLETNLYDPAFRLFGIAA